MDAPYARSGRTPGAHTRQSLHTSALLLRRARAGAVSAAPARRAVARVPATAPRHARAAPPASSQRGSGRGFGWSDAPVAPGEHAQSAGARGRPAWPARLAEAHAHPRPAEAERRERAARRSVTRARERGGTWRGIAHLGPLREIDGAPSRGVRTAGGFTILCGSCQGCLSSPLNEATPNRRRPLKRSRSLEHRALHFVWCGHSRRRSTAGGFGEA